MEKIYLGKGQFIKKDAWDVIKSQTDDSKFVKYLSVAVWTQHTLVNRYVQEVDNMILLPERSRRKILTPRKKKVVEGISN